MSRPWVSSTGVRVRDLVPASLRRSWVSGGQCPGRDLYGLFRDQVRDHPDRDAVIDEQGVVSYAALDLLVRQIAATLRGRGLGRRDIVGIRLPNGRAAVAAELAVAAIGAVSLVFPTGRGVRDAVSLLGRSRARGLLVTAGADPVPADRLPHLRVVLGLPRLGSIPDGPGPPAPDLPIDPEAPARILVSSGSEAEPTMVAYSHNAFAGGRASYLRALHGDDTPMRNLVLVPLASSFGSCGVPVTVAALGATLIVPRRFDPDGALRMIDRHRPTHLFGVPTMLSRIADRLPDRPARPDGLRTVVSSGAALPEVTARRCAERFGVPVVTVYGSTDGVNCHTARTGPNSGTGRPDPDVAAIRIVDERGESLPPEVPGEICALGPMTPLCQVGTPDLGSRHRLPGGWVRTGDRGLIDRNGLLHVIGRIKQVVIRGGLTISPAEVEAQLAGHPSIAEVVCVGVPDHDLGERLCACVVGRPGSSPPTLDQVNGFLGEQGLEPHKFPERLVVLPALPLGATGKVCRASLSVLASAGQAP